MASKRRRPLSKKQRQFEGGTRLQPIGYAMGPGQAERHNTWKMVDGVYTMPPKWRQYLDWLLSDPREPETLREVAEVIGIHPDTLKKIRRDKRFREVWAKEAQEKNVDIDRVQDVVNAMHRKAMNGDVKAAQLYLQYIDRFMPTRRVVIDAEPSVSELSDAELADRLREQAAKLDGITD